MHTTPTGNIPETPELGTPRYNGENFGSQWCLLLRGSTVVRRLFDVDPSPLAPPSVIHVMSVPSLPCFSLTCVLH